MEWISNSNILIVGLGLIGGSYAQALHRLGCGLAGKNEAVHTAARIFRSKMKTR